MSSAGQTKVSPRKFSEKIALLNKKEKEANAKFEEIIKEVQGATKVNLTQPPTYTSQYDPINDSDLSNDSQMLQPASHQPQYQPQPHSQPLVDQVNKSGSVDSQEEIEKVYESLIKSVDHAYDEEQRKLNNGQQSLLIQSTTLNQQHRPHPQQQYLDNNGRPAFRSASAGPDRRSLQSVNVVPTNSGELATKISHNPAFGQQQMNLSETSINTTQHHHGIDINNNNNMLPCSLERTQHQPIHGHQLQQPQQQQQQQQQQQDYLKQPGQIGTYASTGYLSQPQAPTTGFPPLLEPKSNEDLGGTSRPRVVSFGSAAANYKQIQISTNHAHSHQANVHQYNLQAHSQNIDYNSTNYLREPACDRSRQKSCSDPTLHVSPTHDSPVQMISHSSELRIAGNNINQSQQLTHPITTISPLGVHQSRYDNQPMMINQHQTNIYSNQTNLINNESITNNRNGNSYNISGHNNNRCTLSCCSGSQTNGPESNSQSFIATKSAGHQEQLNLGPCLSGLTQTRNISTSHRMMIREDILSGSSTGGSGHQLSMIEPDVRPNTQNSDVPEIKIEDDDPNMINHLSVHNRAPLVTDDSSMSPCTNGRSSKDSSLPDISNLQFGTTGTSSIVGAATPAGSQPTLQRTNDCLLSSQNFEPFGDSCQAIDGSWSSSYAGCQARDCVDFDLQDEFACGTIQSEHSLIDTIDQSLPPSMNRSAAAANFRPQSGLLYQIQRHQNNQSSSNNSNNISNSECGLQVANSYQNGLVMACAGGDCNNVISRSRSHSNIDYLARRGGADKSQMGPPPPSSTVQYILAGCDGASCKHFETGNLQQHASAQDCFNLETQRQQYLNQNIGMSIDQDQE